MLTLFMFMTVFVGMSAGGSSCPPREDIYPCSCVAVPQGKRLFYTIVSCHKLHSTDSLNVIFSSLKSMQIDQFYLYDSFWELNKLGTSEEQTKQVLPTDWITLLKIKELEIVDTTLSSCFACHSRLNCKNSITTRFSAINSSSSEKICTLCDTPKGNKFSWTGCMNKLKHFEFIHGKLTVLRTDLFPVVMRQLTVLKLSHNQIEKIEKDALKNLPRLKILDISHNALETLPSMFAGKEIDLEFLDVSWNQLQTLGEYLFASAPSLKTLTASNNLITDMKEADWKVAPDSLRDIDLRENPLHCDCSILWINKTFHINVILQGFCATPEDYENTLLRKASRLLSTRCDEEGNIGTRGTKKKQEVTTPLS